MISTQRSRVTQTDDLAYKKIVKLKSLIPFSFMVLFWIGCATKPPTTERQSPQQRPDESDAAPSTVRLDKKYFIVHYDPQHRQARYVVYRLRAENLKRSYVKREDRFHADTDLLKMKLPAIGPKDYEHTGFDRGHLAPSGDFEWSAEANDSTFTMANMSPQKPQLNRSAWRGLEDAVRNWACSESELLIVTGPLFDGQSQKLSAGVTIPKRFFKVVLDLTPPKKAIGFILEQGDSQIQTYKQRVKTVREVEGISGFNFFEDLPKQEQDSVENTADLNNWKGSKCRGAAKSSN